mmetsp:Transcript_97984/g.277137  ORF Transcript_97984/g.277137 Transcript_97984/m.277137 type:complete len:326 (-) Transcript_97984:338-1315(-)
MHNFEARGRHGQCAKFLPRPSSVRLKVFPQIVFRVALRDTGFRFPLQLPCVLGLFSIVDAHDGGAAAPARTNDVCRHDESIALRRSARPQPQTQDLDAVYAAPTEFAALGSVHCRAELADALLKILWFREVSELRANAQTKVKHIIWWTSALTDARLNAVPLFQESSDLVDFAFQVVLVDRRQESHTLNLHRGVETELPLQTLLPLGFVRSRLPVLFRDVVGQIHQPAERRHHSARHQHEVCSTLPRQAACFAHIEVTDKANVINDADPREGYVAVREDLVDKPTGLGKKAGAFHRSGKSRNVPPPRGQRHSVKPATSRHHNKRR